MAYDLEVADQIRTVIGPHPGLTEREMFGGISFMINGNMAVGVSGDELMVRVGTESHEEALARPGARPSIMGTRDMKGWVKVAEEGFSTADDFASWVKWGVDYAESLPPK